MPNAGNQRQPPIGVETATKKIHERKQQIFLLKVYICFADVEIVLVATRSKLLESFWVNNERGEIKHSTSSTIMRLFMYG
jgi:hypothetical protein